MFRVSGVANSNVALWVSKIKEDKRLKICSHDL